MILRDQMRVETKRTDQILGLFVKSNKIAHSTFLEVLSRLIWTKGGDDADILKMVKQENYKCPGFR